MHSLRGLRRGGRLYDHARVCAARLGKLHRHAAVLSGARHIDGDAENLVPGSDLVGRDLDGSDWRVSLIRVATDGTREDALRIVAAIEEGGDYAADTEPGYNPSPAGTVVTVWEDQHGQWSLALIEV